MLLSSGVSCCLSSGVFTTEKDNLTVTNWTTNTTAQRLQPVTAELLWSLNPAQPAWTVLHCGQLYRDWKWNGFYFMGKQGLPNCPRNRKRDRWCLSSSDGHMCSLLPNQLWSQSRNSFSTELLWCSVKSTFQFGAGKCDIVTGLFGFPWFLSCRWRKPLEASSGA